MIADYKLAVITCDHPECGALTQRRNRRDAKAAAKLLGWLVTRCGHYCPRHKTEAAK